MGIFKENNNLQKQENTKVNVSVSIKKIQKANATCVINGEKSEACKQAFKELGIPISDED